MSRWLTTFALASFYLLQSTWLLHAGMDLLFPRVGAAKTSSESCCTSACGCPEETRTKKDCCCVKHARGHALRRAAAPVSSIEEAQCKGLLEAMSQALTQPALCGFARISLEIVTAMDLPLQELHPSLEVTSTSPDKVPIARA